jgi:hypothetical protein
MRRNAEVGAEGFEVGGGEAAFAFEDAVGDGAIYFQNFGEAIAAEVVLFDEVFEEVETGAGGERFDVVGVVAFDER